MNTPWHAFWSYLAFHRKEWWPKAVIGSIFPDVPFFISSAYFFIRDGVNMENWVLAYEHPLVKPIGFFTHSIVVALAGLAVALFLRRSYWYPYFYGWIFHIFTDMLTHVSDAQPVFWPLSLERFTGPVSYWERNHYSHELSIANLAVASLFAFYLLLTKNGRLHLAHTKIQIILFGFFSVYLVGGGVLMLGLGWLSIKILPLYIIPGALFFLLSIHSYRLRRKYK
jgi:hypothetical protein